MPDLPEPSRLRPCRIFGDEVGVGRRVPIPGYEVVNVLEGVLELTVNGEVSRLEPGDVFVIPPDAPHSGRALTACRVLDVFAPVREDYR